MKELLFFYLPACPHCLLAERLLKELIAETPAYAGIPITRINEVKQRDLAERYDYWYVPCFILDGEKLHEGHAEKEDLRRVLDAALPFFRREEK